jgi:hypothetical protein
MAADLVLLNDVLDVEETWIGGIGSKDAGAAGSAARRG